MEEKRNKTETGDTINSNYYNYNYTHNQKWKDALLIDKHIFNLLWTLVFLYFAIVYYIIIHHWAVFSIFIGWFFGLDLNYENRR